VFNDYLKTIAARMKSYGEHMQPSCSDVDLISLKLRAKQKLGSEIPNGYEQFLKETNGLDWNGLVIYGSERRPIVGYSDRILEGFVEANLDFRDFDPFSDFLIFADDGVALFTYHIKHDKYEIILRVGLSLLESFDTFDKLLSKALSGRL